MPSTQAPGGGTGTPAAPNPSTATGAAAGATTSSTGTVYFDWARYAAEVMLAQVTGSVPSIPNPLATASLDTAILTDPATIRAYRDTIASQMNDGAAQAGGPRFEDLSDRIADVIIDDQAQGASTLEVQIIDPLWVIPNAPGFIVADALGYLQPLDINFPTGTSCVWRLCQYRPSYGSASGANLILTFEDRIVSQLRELSAANTGVVQGQPNQTLIEFFQMLIKVANQTLRPTPKLTLVPMIAGQDPNAVLQVTEIPTARALQKLKPTGLDAQMQHLLNTWTNVHHDLWGAFPSGGTTTIGAVEQQTAGKIRQLLGRDTFVPSGVAGAQSLANMPGPTAAALG